QALEPATHLLRRRGAGRLADDADDGSGVVRREGFERALQHEAPDAVVEVASAEPDRVRHAFTGGGEMATDGLEPRSRGRGEPNAAARHRVGESERHAADDRAAAIGAHHEETALAREALPAHF